MVYCVVLKGESVYRLPMAHECYVHPAVEQVDAEHRNLRWARADAPYFGILTRIFEQRYNFLCKVRAFPSYTSWKQWCFVLKCLYFSL